MLVGIDTIPQIIQYIYIEDLITKLKNIGVHVYGYADDIAILSPDIHHLNKSINTVTKWCSKNKMSLNK